MCKTSLCQFKRDLSKCLICCAYQFLKHSCYNLKPSPIVDIFDENICHYAFFLFYLPYLSSIHEKANCIAILWTVSPHSLGSCLFRGFYGPPVFHIKMGRPVKCLAQGHNKRTCRLVLHNLPEMPSAKHGSCGYNFLKSFGMTRQGE